MSDPAAPPPLSSPIEGAGSRDDPAVRPTVTLLPGHAWRAEAGHPWIFSNEVRMDEAAAALPPGDLVTLCRAGGSPLGIAMFNPHTLIAARLLHRDARQAISRRFFAVRLERALALRERLFPLPFYRLVHAEADGLPGLIVDRFGTAVVVQANAAGIARLEPVVLDALASLLHPTAVVLRNDGPVRAQEGLPTEIRLAQGRLEDCVTIEEQGTLFPVDLLAGQKTGWFYDQRDNRSLVAGLAAGARVLDLYCYGGGFAVRAARAGAAAVTAIDSSSPALELAARAAALNGVGTVATFRRADVFAEAARLAASGERFDIVVADPPAFARSRRGVGPALRGYRKLARLAAGLTVPRGFLFLASCSFHVGEAEFAEAVRRGLADAGRSARILRRAGAAADHPVHPALPESAYLKTMTLTLD